MGGKEPKKNVNEQKLNENKDHELAGNDLLAKDGKKKAPIVNKFHPKNANRPNIPPRRHKISLTPAPGTMKTVLSAFVCTAIGVLAYHLFYSSFNFRRTDTCNMTIAENRDFHKFYGLQHARNPFTITKDDTCDAHIVFRAILPSAILRSDHSASSFIIMGESGAGKTLLRCQYFKSLSSSQYFKVLILNKDLNEYLEMFVDRTLADDANCEGANCVMSWSNDEFAQVLLSMLATRLVDEYEKEKEMFALSEVPMDEKIELISILCFYYHGKQINQLESFVNFFLQKTSASMYKASTARTQMVERGVYKDTLLFRHLKTDLNKFTVLERNYQKLELLLAVLEGEHFTNKGSATIMHGNVLKDLTRLSTFLRNHLKKSVVFIIDGIDKNHHLVHQQNDTKLSLQSFIRSSVSQEILSLTMAQKFYLSLFYPQVNATDIQDVISRNDGFSTYRIEWNTKSLINYADYVLQSLNKNGSLDRCKPLPDFEKLVNFTNPQSADVIRQIATPRALNRFMEQLIMEMNNCAKDSEQPFIATFKNVDNAFMKSDESQSTRRIRD